MLFNIFFGAIIKIAKAPPRNPPLPPETISSLGQPPDGTSDTIASGKATGAKVVEDAYGIDALPAMDYPGAEADEETFSSQQESPEKHLLTSLLPDPGYFAIGACAGVVSRTCTAPLDRLKVYLIAHTSPVDNSLDAVKKGNVADATKKLGRPLVAAYKDLLQAGGWRNLFAGMCSISTRSFRSETNNI